MATKAGKARCQTKQKQCVVGQMSNKTKGTALRGVRHLEKVGARCNKEIIREKCSGRLVGPTRLTGKGRKPIS